MQKLTKSDFKEYLNAQRYLVLAVASALASGDIESSEETLNYLWESIGDLGVIYGIDLLSMDDIVKHGKEIEELEKMYNAN